jgi:hypothetical protein
MKKNNFISIMISTIILFIIGSVYYAIFGSELAKYSTAFANQEFTVVKAAVELVRCVILSFVLVTLVSMLGITNWIKALGIALLLWVGFPFVLLLGAINHENTPIMLAIIHSGDWLIKLIVVILILVFRNKKNTNQ